MNLSIFSVSELFVVILLFIAFTTSQYFVTVCLPAGIEVFSSLNLCPIDMYE